MFLSVFLLDQVAAPLLKRPMCSLENLEDVAGKCRAPIALMGAQRPIAAGGSWRKIGSKMGKALRSHWGIETSSQR